MRSCTGVSEPRLPASGPGSKRGVRCRAISRGKSRRYDRRGQRQVGCNEGRVCRSAGRETRWARDRCARPGYVAWLGFAIRDLLFERRGQAGARPTGLACDLIPPAFLFCELKTQVIGSSNTHGCGGEIVLLVHGRRRQDCVCVFFLGPFVFAGNAVGSPLHCIGAESEACHLSPVQLDRNFLTTHRQANVQCLFRPRAGLVDWSRFGHM